jgi:hypothetical protein
MNQIYGKMIIKKDTILYHTSDEPFQYNPTKNMLFCTFHPSEYTGDNEFVHFIILKRDVELLFMVDHIHRIKLFSALNQIIDHPNKNMAKNTLSYGGVSRNNGWNYGDVVGMIHPFILQEMVTKLQQDRLDGWFSSIENRSNVEIAFINDRNIYDVIHTEKLKRNWNNGHYDSNNNDKIIVKNGENIKLARKKYQ